MVLEEITIKLIRYGGNTKPSYSLTLKGNGELVYTGFEKVKFKGKIRENLDEDIFLEILSEFKEIDFFSKTDSYIVDKRSGRPYTNITISIPVSQDNIKTSSITHHDDDFNVSLDIIELEKKIDTLIGSSKWIKIDEPKIEKKEEIKSIISKPDEKIKQKPIKEKIEKRKIFSNKKSIILFLSIIAIVAVVIAAASIFLFTDIFTQDNSTNNNSDTKVEFKINYLVTTGQSERINDKRSTEKLSFEGGDTVYVDFEVQGINHNGTVNIFVMLAVSYGDDMVHYNSFTTKIYNYKVNSYYKILNFTANKTWFGGRDYNVTIQIRDKITDKQIYKQTKFRLKSNGTSPVIPLFAKISSLKKVNELEVYFEANASGGTGFYDYSWDIFDSYAEYVDTVTGKTGTYTFSEKGVYFFKLTVDDGEDYYIPDEKPINLLT